MSKEFDEISSYLERLRLTFFSSIRGYYVYVTIVNSIEPHLEIINKLYRTFFASIIESSRDSFLSKLSLIFDKHKKALHINQLLKYARNNMLNLSKDNFIKRYPDKARNRLFEDYKQISEEDLSLIESWILDSKGHIENLRTYRNNFSSHSSIEIINLKLEKAQIDKLFELVEKIFQLLSLRVEFEDHYYDPIKRGAVEDARRVIDHLVRFQPYFES